MKRVQAFFRNENEAESFKASLQTLKVQDVMVEKVPLSNRNLWDLLRDTFSRNEAFNEHQHEPYVVEFQVEEEEYGEAKNIISDNNGYIQ